MTQIRLEKVAFGYTDTLFEDVTLAIGDGDRIGIVGNNGSGKSTLLKCIAGMIEPNKGRIACPKGIKFGFIEQDIPEALKNLNLYEVISAAIPADEREYSSWKVDVALDIFKTPDSIRHKPVRELSGGWQRLALIARTGLSEPDILLLDEPTNHLDVEKILVLEQWLNEQVYNIPVVAISHDRSFLTNCTNKTLFVRGTQVREYAHPYERAKELLAEDDKAASSQRAREEKEMGRLKRSAHELRQVGVNNRSDTALRKSQQIAKRAENLETNLTDVHVEERRDIKLGSSDIQAKRLIGIKDVTISAPDGRQLFHIDKLDIMQGDRLVVVGPNGSGKSQFLQHLHRAFADIEAAKVGGVAITPSAKLGYIDQHLSNLPLGQGLHDYVSREFSLDNQRTTSVLITAGFAVPSQNTKLGSLSHGQRARVALLGLHLSNPNFYIMDEPTNHLDIAGQEQLEAEILDHGAASILVSHDRTFAQNIGTKFYAIVNRKLEQITSPDVVYEGTLGTPEAVAVNRNSNTKKKHQTPRPS